MVNSKGLVYKILNEIKHNKRHIYNWTEWTKGFNEDDLFLSLEKLIEDTEEKLFQNQLVESHFQPIPMFKKMSGKKYTSDHDDSNIQHLTNIISFDSATKINRNEIEYNYFFLGDEKSLALSAIWLEEIGVILNNTLRDTVYANRTDNSSSFFSPYYYAYSKFRNSSFEQMKKLVEENRTGIYVQLDLETCFYNVNICFLKDCVEKTMESHFEEAEIDERTKEYLLNLNLHIFQIIENYSKQMNDIKGDNGNGYLPIGFLPSNVLINIYLSKFDKELQQTFNPIEYGRYVDDIGMLISRELTSDDKYEQVNQIKEQLNKIPENISEYKNTLKLNLEKTIFFIITEKNDINYLKKFEQSITKLSSDYHRLIDTETFEAEFNKAYLLSEDAIKLTEMFEITRDKKYLSRMISTIYYSFFGSFNKVNSASSVQLARDFRDYFYSFVDDEFFIELHDYWYQLVSIELIADGLLTSEVSTRFERTAIEDTQTVQRLFSLLSGGNRIKDFKSYLNWDNIKGDELNQFIMVYLCAILNTYSRERPNKSLDEIQRYFREPRFKNDILGENELLLNYENQLKLLWSWSKHRELKKIESIINNFHEGFKKIEKNVQDYKQYGNKEEISFAQASFYSYDKRFLSFHHHSINKTSLSDVIQVLNEAHRNEVDVICFPELGFTFENLPIIVRQAARTNMLLIGGLDFILADKHVLNLTIAIIPIVKIIKGRNYRDAHILISPKKFPSPEEYEVFNHSRNINGIQSREIYIPSKVGFHSIIFHYRGIKHAVINCYEATDIFLKHEIAKHEPHIVHLITNNRDVKYYNQIAQSLSRDLMCAISITNYSKLGGTLLFIPYKEEYKRIVSQHKGSLNTHIDVSKIDFKPLINKRYDNKNEIFKQNPPYYYYSNIFGKE